MSLLLLLSIPGTFVMLVGLLSLSAWVEQHALSPRSLVTSAVKARRSSPEYVEALTAMQFARLLEERSGTKR